MHFKKALRLSVTNFPLILKTIMVQLIIISLIVAIFAMSVSATFDTAVELLSELQLKEDFNVIVSDFAAYFSGDESFDSNKLNDDIFNVISKLRDALDRIQGMFISLSWAAVGLLLGIMVYRYLLALTDIPAVSHLTEFMETANSRPYIWYFFKNLGKTLKFSLWQMISTLWMDALILFGVVGTYVFVLAPLRTAGIIISVVFLFFAYSARQTMFTFWLPQMIVNRQGVRESLKISFQKIAKVFWTVFWKIFLIISLSSIFTLLINYFTQDLTKLNWVSIVLSAIVNLYSFLLVKCVGAVEYFELEEKPYFTKRVKIELTSETVK
ncbi:MAG TPA: hypothetical protein P5087_05325 [Eubacteriales bacterium]|nr:hypothetical protein [Eubacteriales bacterium]